MRLKVWHSLTVEKIIHDWVCRHSLVQASWATSLLWQLRHLYRYMVLGLHICHLAWPQDFFLLAQSALTSSSLFLMPLVRSVRQTLVLLIAPRLVNISSLSVTLLVLIVALYPHANPMAVDLLQKMLGFDPSKRISVTEACNTPTCHLYMIQTLILQLRFILISTMMKN